MIEAKQLSLAECEEIYSKHLVKDFPADEVKPFESIRRVTEAGLYKSWGFYEAGRLVAYAFLCDDPAGSFCLLDYYAVDASLRGQGYGQKVMVLLRELYGEYAGLIIESENPEFAKDEADLSIRRRRIGFYEKCGLTVSGVRGRAFGVEFKILYAACAREASDAEIGAALSDIYHALVPEPAYGKHIQILVNGR